MQCTITYIEIVPSLQRIFLLSVFSKQLLIFFISLLVIFCNKNLKNMWTFWNMSGSRARPWRNRHLDVCFGPLYFFRINSFSRRFKTMSLDSKLINVTQWIILSQHFNKCRTFIFKFHKQSSEKNSSAANRTFQIWQHMQSTWDTSWSFYRIFAVK
jgi:hypothetical protein